MNTRLVLAACLSVCLLPGCSHKSSVSVQVVAAIHELEAHAEEGHRSAFMARITETFQGQGGRLNRQDFRGFLLLQWNRNRRIHAQLLTIDVEPQGNDRAQARIRALLTGGRGLLPERGRLYDIQTVWIRQDGEWRVDSADWTPVDLMD